MSSTAAVMLPSRSVLAVAPPLAENDNVVVGMPTSDLLNLLAASSKPCRASTGAITCVYVYICGKAVRME